MNTYSKFCPNVFLAKCTEQHEKGEVINVETKYGKENECIVHNLIYQKDGFYFYSITRADGFNAQERAMAKADKYNGYAANAEKRGDAYYERSQEGKDFLSLAEPIKIGHHSEKRHRALIERTQNAFGKFVEENKKAEAYESKAEYWERKAKDINLSMPESLEYFEYKLEKAKEYHEGLKSGKYERQHSYSLTYAKKEVNEIEKNLELAKRLWSQHDR